MSTATTSVLWCPACGNDVEAWAPGPGGRPSASCPTCWSLERHRFLASVLRGLRPFVESASFALEYAPQPQIRSLLRSSVGDDRYVGIDLMDLRFATARVDACQLPFADNSVDLLIQFHVLEHIPDDHLAMTEMARVLSPGGLGLVQVPWGRDRPTDEDPTASPAERKERFGQADHVRYYGADFSDRLEASGLRSTLYEAAELMDEDALSRCGVPANNPLWILRTTSGR